MYGPAFDTPMYFACASRELGEHRVQLLQLQARHLLVEVLRQRVHAHRVLRRVREQLDLRDRLVRERRGHHVQLG